MSNRVLLYARMMPGLENQLRSEFDAHPLWEEADPDTFLQQRGHEFSVLVTNATAGASAAVMKTLPSLKAVCSLGVGVDAIDLGFAGKQGIAVSNTPDVLTGCVADLAMGLLTDAARGISTADRFVRAGKWDGRPYQLGVRVHGKRLGLLGFGRIGQAIARRATGFEMEIRYHTRRPVASSPGTHEPDLASLAEWADFLVVACSGGPETAGMVSGRILDALGPEGFLVNIARGSVVDEEALVRSLEEKKIAGAGLDVFAQEPVVPSRLYALDNVVLLPHIGSGTRETRGEMANLVFENVKSFVSNAKLVTPVQS